MPETKYWYISIKLNGKCMFRVKNVFILCYCIYGCDSDGNGVGVGTSNAVLL